MVFFDLDGTLLDSNGIWLDIDIAFLGRHGISPVPEDYTWYVTHHSAPDSARYTRERFGLAETAKEIQGAWLDMAREAYAGQLVLKPGVRAFLEQCREHGVPMAVLTSCIPELCRAALARHGCIKTSATAPREPLPDLQTTFNLEQAERLLVQRALDACQGNKSRAAELLGITREGLRKKLLRLDKTAHGHDGEEA